MPGKQDTNNPMKEATSLMFKFSLFKRREVNEAILSLLS